MKVLMTSLCAIGLAVGSAALAQVHSQAQPQAQQPTPPTAPAEQPATQVSEADMQKFAEIYVDVETTRVQVAEEMNAAKEALPPEEAQVRLQQELVATIEQHGWSIDRYNRVATAISNDPEKRDKTVELINKIVSS
jgi:hypothetical protein